MAAAKNVGFAYGFNVHDEDEGPGGGEFGRPDTTDFTEAGHLVRDVIYGSNFTASHLVHFYHLAALDFVDASNAGAASLDKSPACPRHGPQPGDPLYPYYYRIPPVLNTYLVAQYVLALKFRRLCNQIGGLWGGRAPFVQGLTPGGATPSVTAEKIDKTRRLLYSYDGTFSPTNPGPGTILKFIGTPFDFANWLADTGGDPSKLPIIGDGTYGGTMMFDVVAVAMYYPEYFWMGNAYERFLAYGVFEKGDLSNPIGDNRLFSRGRKNTGAKYSNQTGVLPATFSGAPAELLPAQQGNVFESIKHSHYIYPAPTSGWKHPLQGETIPTPEKTVPTYDAYSWVKAPRYKDTSDPDFTTGAVPYEAGPLARMQVNGDYYGGILYDLGYTAVPNLPWTGPGAFPLAGAKVPEYGDPGPDLGTLLSALPGYFPDLSGISYNGDSALDRYAARQVECWKVAHAIVGWLDRLEADHIGGVTSRTRVPPAAGGTDRFYGQSYGWTEAPRGALGHWMKSNGATIEKYQCVVPSTWNASPQDAFDVHGPAERAMMNTWTKSASVPLEILRVSHAWDFCTACAVHLVSKDGKKKEEHTFTFNPAPTGG